MVNPMTPRPTKNKMAAMACDQLPLIWTVTLRLPTGDQLPLAGTAPGCGGGP